MLTDIVADSLIIGETNIRVFRDRSYPDDKLSRVGQFPQQLLMSMPVTLSLKKLIVKELWLNHH